MPTITKKFNAKVFPIATIAIFTTSPMTAHAADTPVVVNNTTANPVPTTITNPANNPVNALIANPTSKPIPSVITNTLGAPIPSVITNPATNPANVLVANTTSKPVPSLITNTGAAPVPALILNSTAAPVPTVIFNTTAVPVKASDINKPAHIPFSKRFDMTFTNGSTSATLTVPAGKRLVITYMSADAGVYPNASVLFDLAVTNAGEEVEAHLPMIPQGVLLGQQVSSMSQQTMMFADPGSTVTVAALDSDTTHSGGLIVGVFGYLVDAAASSFE